MQILNRIKLLIYKALGRFPFSLGLSTRFQIKAIKYNVRLMAPEAQEEFKRILPQVSEKISIDLGANLGVYTKLLANYSKLVIAFEPDPWTFEKLNENVGYIKNVKLENLAVGPSDGFVKLYRHEDFDCNKAFFSESSSVWCRSDFNEGDSVDVNQVDFIRYIEDLDKDIGMIKMDIEGMELELLEALVMRPDLLSRIDYIFVETHERLFPEKLARFNQVRKQVHQIHKPRINLNWH